jgi:hypothetical protein
VVGSASLRRQSQILYRHPDLKVWPFLLFPRCSSFHAWKLTGS